MHIEEGRQKVSVRGIPCDIGYTFHWSNQADPGSVPNILLIHGHSSSRKEHVDLLPYLGTANVFTFDLPNCGTSGDVDREQLAKLYRALGAKPDSDYPGLVYCRDAVIDFIAKAIAPRIPAKSLRIAGGSLGGNLVLTLVTRTPRFTWLRDAVVWSPGSAWGSDLFQAVGGSPALQRADEDWSGDARRRAFFKGSWADPVVPFPVTNPAPRPQPWYWYWDEWGGPPFDRLPDLTTGTTPWDLQFDASGYPRMSQRKADEIRNGLRLTYHYFAADVDEARWNAVGANRAKWHWQVASDELAYSHRPVIQNTTADILFLAGVHDDADPSNLFRYTRELQELLKKSGAPVWSAFLPVSGSGHSIHNERPAYLAGVLLGALHA